MNTTERNLGLRDAYMARCASNTGYNVHGFTRWEDGAWIRLEECDPDCTIHHPED